MEGTNFPAWRGTRTSALPDLMVHGTNGGGSRCRNALSRGTIEGLVNPHKQRWVRVHKPVDVTCEAPLPVLAVLALTLVESRRPRR